MKLGDQRHATPRSLYRRKTDPVPMLQEAGWDRGQSRRVGKKSSPPPGLDPWTVQTVASRYTN